VNKGDIILVSLIIFIVAFFIGIKHFLSLSKTKAHFDFTSDVKNAQPTNEKQEKIKSVKTLIGTNGPRDIFVDNNAKHVFISGTTGSGKTVALANFIKSGIDYDYPLLILDGKGDGGRGSILDIVQKFAPDGKKVYIINLNDPQTSAKYNPFKNTSPTVIKDMLISLTEFTEPHYKLNVERFLQRVINLLITAKIKTSLKNITFYIEIEKFTALSSELIAKKIITKEDHLKNMELAKTSGKIAEGSIARFTSLYESEIGSIFADDGIDIYTALKENAIILFILNPLLYPETSPLFGNLVVIDSKKAVHKLFNDNDKRIFFIFDEFSVYASTVFLDLINKSRSAGVTSILATQSLSDLDAKSGEYFKEQVLENCNNYVILRQNSALNAEKWANIIGTRQSLETTYQLNDGGTTGMGSLRMTREFLYHPDDIKNLKTGNAIYVSKDNHFHSKVIIRNVLNP